MSDRISHDHMKVQVQRRMKCTEEVHMQKCLQSNFWRQRSIIKLMANAGHRWTTKLERIWEIAIYK